MMLNKKVFYFLTLLIFFMAGQSCAQAKVLVSGNGFEITQDYLDAFGSFYEAANFSTTEDEFLKQAVSVKVFATEASSMELEPAEVSAEHWAEADTKEHLKQTIVQDIGLAEAYMRKRMEDYEVDDVLIESFYRSNPEKFLEGTWSEADILPLDKELKKSIRSEIVEAVANRLVSEFYLEVEDKYEIEYVD